MLGALLGFLPAGSEADDDVVRARLKSVTIKEASYLLAPELQGELPKKAWRAKLFGRRYLFFDLDQSGQIEAGGSDGFALEKASFVVPLPSALLVPEGQYSLAHEKKDLVLTRQTVGLDPDFLREVAELNTMRMRGARTPVVLDVEACAHAQLHLDYLEFNGLTRELSLEIHAEDPEARGYTPEGAKAGQVGVIGFGRNFREDLAGWYASAYHGAKILDPKLRRIGVARQHQLSLLYPLENPWHGREPVLHPPRGATGIPLEFSRGGEIPNPAPGTDLGRGLGFPVVVMLPRSTYAKRVVTFELLGPRQKPVPGFVSSPSAPASEQLPENLGCAFFIPEGPLDPETRYTVRFQQEGMPEALEWSFTTGEEPKKKR